MDNKLELTTDSVRVLLMNYEVHKQRIREHILSLYKELEDTDSYIEELAYRKSEMNGMPKKKGGLPKSLFEVMEQHNELMKSRLSEIAAGIEISLREEEALRRVWVCYQSLPYEEYDVITQLYVNAKPYKQVEAESQFSHGKFEKTRKKGLEDILKLYNSDLGFERLCGLSYERLSERKTIEKECKDTYQYSLALDE